MDTGGYDPQDLWKDTKGFLCIVAIAKLPVPRTNAPESNPQAVSGFVPYRVVVATNLVGGWATPIWKNILVKFGSWNPNVSGWKFQKSLSCHPETYNDVHVEVEHIRLKHWKLSSHCEAVQLMHEDVKLQATRPWQGGKPQGTQWRTLWNRKVFRFDSDYRSDMIWRAVRGKCAAEKWLDQKRLWRWSNRNKEKGITIRFVPSISEVNDNIGCPCLNSCSYWLSSFD